MSGRSLLACLVSLAPLGAEAAIYRYDYVGAVTEAVYRDVFFNDGFAEEFGGVPREYDGPELISGPRTGTLTASFTLDEARLGAPVAGMSLSWSDDTRLAALSTEIEWSDPFGNSIDYGEWRASIPGKNGYWQLDAAFDSNAQIVDVRFESDQDGWSIVVGETQGSFYNHRDFWHHRIGYGPDPEYASVVVNATGSWTRTVLDPTPYGPDGAAVPVPLPPAGLLLGAGAIALAGLRRRR